MRAVGVRTFGGPEALEILELPEPHAGPGEIRVRVRAAAVNPTDTLLRSGARELSAPPPYVPGMDIAGVVDEVGDGVDGFAAGTAVMAIVVPEGSHGGYAEQVVVPADSAVPAPAGADHAHAATLPMNGLTARRALDLLEPEPGSTIAVTGAAGAFGGYVVQLARAAGLQVVADAAETDETLVKDLGAHLVVPRGDGVASAIREAVPDGVAVLADGSLQGDILLGAVRDGGRIATVRGHRGPQERGISWHPVSVRDVARDRGRLDALRALAESGAVTLRVADIYPAERAAEAHARLEAGGVRGRLVLTF